MNATRNDSPDAIASRVYEAMRHLVLDADDRRREVVEATGMSFIRTKALRRLVDKPMRMTELAAALLTDKPYTTLVVDDLERRGLVVRTVASDDRRAKVVTVTDAGSAMAARAEEILTRVPAALAQLDAAELQTLDRVLAKVAR